MKVQIKVGNKWKDADATIRNGIAIITLPHPLGTIERKVWRKVKAKRARK